MKIKGFLKSARKPIGRSISSVFILGLWLGIFQTGSFAEEVHTTKLTLHPTAAPNPVLKYRFLPTYLERQPGNAAPIYQQTIAQYLTLQNDSERSTDQEQYSEWLELPIDKFPVEKIQKQIRVKSNRLKNLADASIREQCDWGLQIREKDPVTLLLPHISPIRSLFRIQQLQTRCNIVHGKLDESLRNIRTEFAMARHMAKPPILICDLVGIAMARQACTDLEWAIQQPECPNLYWSLVQLPRPFISMRETFETESELLFMIAPELRNTEDDSLGPDYWRAALNRLVEKMGDFGVMSHDKNQNSVLPTGIILVAYPKAKRSLIEDWGYSPERIEAMPTAQVVALHTVKTYEMIRDECFKRLALPDHEWRNHTKRINRQDWERWQKKESIPLASMLLPAIDAAKDVEIRLTQRFDRLRTIEAIRLYAHQHDGKLPERLEQITEVPLPVDPGTGELFPYRLEGDTAIIEYKWPNQKKHVERCEIRIAKLK